MAKIGVFNSLRKLSADKFCYAWRSEETLMARSEVKRAMFSALFMIKNLAKPSFFL